MLTDESLAKLQYALAKQVGSISSVETDYGHIPLDAETLDLLEDALRGIITKKIARHMAAVSDQETSSCSS